MYKIKNTYVDSMIKAKLSSCEIDFLLYIGQYQSEAGVVESVYYADICEKLGFSIQKFYDILHSLSEKGLIACNKNNPSDVAVTLLGNSFSSVDFSSGNVPGYINLAQHKFLDAKFKELKAGSKLFYLFSQRFIMGKHMLVENFYNTFCELFNVARKTLQMYIHELKKRKLLFISRKRNKNYNYEMTMKPSTVLFDKNILPREKGLYEDNIVQMIERNFQKYLPNPDFRGKYKDLEDIAALTEQKRALKHENFVSLIVLAIKGSIGQQRREGKKKPVINAALVNKWIPIASEQYFEKKYGLA
ncbi:MAG: hypothetical protein K6A05_06765 [Lachnospiraceae bacterium]|nr:hypothetical protein [Lachnospiraceae bacterium]